ncbi:hypothetical protein F2Q69_00062348 [Brassica cretica]|uniref:Uncharacterized protein n=1 Tax=Brassica cretica TaxID=69181 RepID=A0A8S9RKH3_BRACR|nr:hypothetical protein F2Q69_00062348 [Brassica cretica]
MAEEQKITLDTAPPAPAPAETLTPAPTPAPAPAPAPEKTSDDSKALAIVESKFSGIFCFDDELGEKMFLIR